MKFSEFFNGNNDRDIAAQLKAATKITLDASARQKMRGFLSEYAQVRPIRVHASHTSPNVFISFFSHIPISAVAAVLIIVVSTGSVTAAESALPGDLLYPLKVHVTEEVRASLATSPKARAEWELARAERRLEEAATLSLDGTLDEVLRAEIDSNLDAHMAHAGEDQLQLEQENDTSDASNISANIEAIRFARENILGEQRPTFAAAKVAVKTAARTVQAIQPEVTSLSMTAPEAPQEMLRGTTTQDVENPEIRSRGNRAAAKARIEATKKFLNRNTDRLKPQANVLIQEQLKTASDALFSGEESIRRGEESEASDDFHRALERAIETQSFVSEHLKPRDNSESEHGKDQSKDRSGGSNSRDSGEEKKQSDQNED